MKKFVLLFLLTLSLFGESVTLQEGINGYSGCKDVTVIDPAKHYVFAFSNSPVNGGDAVELMLGEFHC